jgi:predicted DNA-binding protein (UPF0251 family)
MGKIAKRGKGRPQFVADEKILTQIEELAALGMNKEQCAKFMGISSKTMSISLKRQPDIETAFDRGRANRVHSALLKLNDLVEEGDFNAIQLILKHIGGWRDKLEVQGQVNHEHSHKLDSSVSEEVDKLVKLFGESSYGPAIEITPRLLDAPSENRHEDSPDQDSIE